MKIIYDTCKICKGNPWGKADSTTSTKSDPCPHCTSGKVGYLETDDPSVISKFLGERILIQNKNVEENNGWYWGVLAWIIRSEDYSIEVMVYDDDGEPGSGFEIVRIPLPLVAEKIPDIKQAIKNLQEIIDEVEKHS